MPQRWGTAALERLLQMQLMPHPDPLNQGAHPAAPVCEVKGLYLALSGGWFSPRPSLGVAVASELLVPGGRRYLWCNSRFRVPQGIGLRLDAPSRLGLTSRLFSPVSCAAGHVSPEIPIFINRTHGTPLSGSSFRDPF